MPLLEQEWRGFERGESLEARGERACLGYRDFTVSSLGFDEKRWYCLGERGRESVDKWDCLGLDWTILERGPIKVKDMILNASIEEKRAADERAIQAFGADGEIPAEA